MSAERMAAVLAEHVYDYPDSFCACGAFLDRPERDYGTHIAAALTQAGFGDVAAAKAEALRELASGYLHTYPEIYDDLRERADHLGADS